MPKSKRRGGPAVAGGKAGKPGVNPGANPGNRPAGKPVNKQANRPANKPANRPANKPVNKPAGRQGNRPGNGAGNKPGNGPWNGAQSGPLAKPRHGIVEISPDSASEVFERVGEASIGDAPVDGGWDIEDVLDAGDAGDDVGDDTGDDVGAPGEFTGYVASEDGAADDQGEDDEGDAIEARQRMRLQRVLADAGVAARRHAEGLIAQGRVTVNGQPVQDLPCFVDPHFDRIHVDGRPIPKPARHVYVMFHKPERVLVTDADEPGMDRKTLRDFVQHPGAPRLFAIGRLDFQTTGVVLMTNDGELANRVSHPRANLAKTYHVVVRGAPTPQNMKVFSRAALMGDREKAREDPRAALKQRSRPRTPLEVRVITSDAGKSLLEVTTRDERNLDIRGACLAAGLPVKKITRVNYGPIRLTALPLGNWRELTRPEINALKKAARLAKDGRASPPPEKPGVDFSNIAPEKLGEPVADQVDASSAKPGVRGVLKPAQGKPQFGKPQLGKPQLGKMQGKPVQGKPGPRPSAQPTRPVARPATGQSRPTARPTARPSRDQEPKPSYRPRVIS